MRKQPRSARGSSMYGQRRGTESPDSFQQTGGLPACPVLQRRSSPSSSRPRQSSLPEGGFEPTGKTSFSASGHCSPLIRRPLKMKREVAAARRASRSAEQRGRWGGESVARSGARSPGQQSGHPTSPTRCPASLCKDGPGAGNASPKPLPQVFAPSPFTHFPNLEMWHFKGREDRGRSSGLTPFTAGPSAPACSFCVEPTVSA